MVLLRDKTIYQVIYCNLIYFDLRQNRKIIIFPVGLWHNGQSWLFLQNSFHHRHDAS